MNEQAVSFANKIAKRLRRSYFGGIKELSVRHPVLGSTTVENPRARNLSLDLLKIALAVAVIGIHTFSLFQSVSQPLYLLKNGIFRIAVPTFFLINGFYLFGTIDNADRFKKWFSRLFSLYALWMVVYLYKFVPHSFSVSAIFRFFLTLVFGYFHLWYLIAALFGGVSLFLVRSLSDRTLAALVAFLILMGTFFQYWIRYSKFWAGVTFDVLDVDSLYRNFLFIGFPYIGLGYLLAKNRIAEKIRISLLFGTLALSIIFIEFEAFYNYIEVGSMRPFDLLIGVPFCVVIVFLLFQKLYVCGSAPWIVRLPSALYLSHPFVLLAAVKYGISYGLTLFVLTAAVTLMISPLLIVVARRYPQLL